MREEVLWSQLVLFSSCLWCCFVPWKIRGVCLLHLASASSRNPIVAFWLCQKLGSGYRSGGMLWNCPGKFYQLCTGRKKKTTQTKQQKILSALSFHLPSANSLAHAVGAVSRAAEFCTSGESLRLKRIPDPAPAPAQHWPPECWVRNLNHKISPWMVMSDLVPALCAGSRLRAVPVAIPGVDTVQAQGKSEGKRPSSAICLTENS